MNLITNPQLLEHLAGAYALGSLRGGARRRFEALAREHAPVRAAALVWQTRLAGMNELQTLSAPSPAVWTRIHNSLQGEKEAASLRAQRLAGLPAAHASGFFGEWLRSLLLWRGAAAVGAFATAMAVATALNLHLETGAEIQALQAKLLATPQIHYVAVLADGKSAASVLVTFDANRQQLTLQRVGAYQEAGDKSLQLWALPPAGGPRSLGVLGQDKLLRLTAGESDMREVPALAISLEPKGGVPGAGGPTGPVLFSGTLIQKML